MNTQISLIAWMIILFYFAARVQTICGDLLNRETGDSYAENSGAAPQL